MKRVRRRGEQIRTFIIKNVDKHKSDIARVAASKFKISRQAVNKHLTRLVEEESLVSEGTTRSRKYFLRPIEKWDKPYVLDSSIQEDVVWRNDIAPSLEQLPDNVFDIWHYGFTEMFNNALDHSEGSRVIVALEKTATHTGIGLMDDGVGIFKKIQGELGLLDERHSVLELSKGKLTTDPANHTGEGIFFTSRVFDEYQILSGGVYFSHEFDKQEDWILERMRFDSGTGVWMKINNHAARTLKRVFNQYTSADDIGFSKTVVPVKLAQYGDDKLVSRSQAKRLLVRVDRFKTVIFDFKGVDGIGQAFADEVFRVFANKNPDIELIHMNANAEVKRMILRAESLDAA